MATYTVKKGDSYASIAGDVYGNQRWMQGLAQANGGRPLTPGMVINLPNFDTAQSPLVTEEFMQSAADMQSVYDAYNQNVAFPNSPYQSGLITPTIEEQAKITPEIYTGPVAGGGNAYDVAWRPQTPTWVPPMGLEDVRSQVDNSIRNVSPQEAVAGLGGAKAGGTAHQTDFADILAGPLSGPGALVAGLFSLAMRPMTLGAAHDRFRLENGRSPNLQERFDIWRNVAEQQGDALRSGTQANQDAIANNLRGVGIGALRTEKTIINLTLASQRDSVYSRLLAQGWSPNAARIYADAWAKQNADKILGPVNQEIERLDTVRRENTQAYVGALTNTYGKDLGGTLAVGTEAAARSGESVMGAAELLGLSLFGPGMATGIDQAKIFPREISDAVAGRLPFKPESKELQQVFMDAWGVTGFDSADALMEAMGYTWYSDKSGLGTGSWILDDVPGAGLYTGSGTPWLNVGTGSYVYPTLSGGGGKGGAPIQRSNMNGGAGQPYGLVQWRIGA